MCNGQEASLLDDLIGSAIDLGSVILESEEYEGDINDSFLHFRYEEAMVKIQNICRQMAIAHRSVKV